MVFSSIIFIFYFLPVTLLLYYLVPFRHKNFVCLIASLFFYAWGEPRYIFLMLFSIVTNFLFGIGIGGARSERAQKQILITSVVFNIGLLFLFKYLTFTLSTLNSFLQTSLYVPSIALPIGISFYTFQAQSYVIDVYRKNAQPQKKLSDLALYISAFPQLIAGPIVRYADIDAQIKHRTITLEKIADGIIRFVIGLSKKVLIANPMAAIADGIFKLNGDPVSTATAWAGIIAYTFQIYFDFSGYSDMAIGLGKMLGFELRENFDYPYTAKSATEFWRRWHISLGQWFRDYLYIPLGGNRKGWAVQIRNIFIVWFLTGLWHGADWTFIAWGIFWGALLTFEKITKRVIDRVPPLLSHFCTLICIMIGWVFFRADSLSGAFSYLGRLAGIGTSSGIDAAAKLIFHDNALLFAAALIGSTPFLRGAVSKLSIAKKRQAPYWGVSALYVSVAFALCVIFLVNSVYNPFIYFRF